MQVPAPFDYARAASVSDAIALLTRHGPESQLVAGGHSLIPMMRLRIAVPSALIDINDLAELTGIERRSDRQGRGDHVRIGAMVRHAELLRSPLVGKLFPILHDAERLIADPVVRNRGTVGGSVCQADPSEDLSAALSALHAEVVIAGEGGERVVPLRELHQGPYQTCIDHAEITVEIRIPVRAGQGSAYAKVKRRVGDWAVVGAGAALTLDGDVVADVGIGLTAVGAPHFVATEAEDLLRGRPATPDSFVEAGRVAARHSNPTADQRGPVDYKRHLVAELVTRALRSATDRARAARSQEEG